MATSDNTPSHRDESSDSEDSDSGSDNGSDSGSQGQQIEWLATGRSKRSTAGNRMKSMLANEEPAADDSDLELLFAEDEDDAGFTDVDKDDASDVQMDSSSDDEDENAAADNEEGEKELQRQAKEKKAAMRKRKAQEAIPIKFRKKVRISQPATGPSATAAPAPRPKKKSERASWLPSPADLPTRSSERQTTRMSKEQLHQQMIEREIKRKKQLEIMEKKAKKLEALKKPPMTQAERLVEAASVEKRNSKSLNRWEEAEKQREEERKAKLAALNNRRLEGPVVTFWSAIVDLSETQLKNVGKMVSMEDKPRKKRQSAAAAKAEAEAKASEQTTPVPPMTTPVAGGPETIKQEPDAAVPPTKNADSNPAPGTALAPPSAPSGSGPVPEATAQAPSNVLEPISESHTNAKFEPVELPSSFPQPSTDNDGPPPAPSAVPGPPIETQGLAPPPSPLAQPSTASEAPASNPSPTTTSPQPTLETPIHPPPSQVAISQAPLQAPNPPLPPTSPAPVEMNQPLAPPPFQRSESGSRLMAPPPIPPPPDMMPQQRSVLAPPAGAMPGMLNSPMPMLGYSSASNYRPNVLAAPTPPRTGSPLSYPAANQAPLMSNLSAVPTPSSNTQSPLPLPSSISPTPVVQPPTQESLPQPPSTPAKPEVSAKDRSVTPSQSTPVPPAKARKSSKATEKQEAHEPPAPEPPLEGKVTRSCIMLQNFDEDAIKSPAVQTQILFGWKMTKLGKPPHPPICAITGHPARYRDPKTGLPYYNGWAYKEIQRISNGDYKWSSLVGAWVGNGAAAARGVPARFLGGPKEAPEEPKPTEPAAAASEEAAKEPAVPGQPATEPVLVPIQPPEVVGETKAQVLQS